MAFFATGAARRVRPVFAVVAALATVGLLAGCQSSPSRFASAGAKAEAAGWVQQVVAAAQPARVTLRSDVAIACASDHSYFATTFSWRNLTTMVPKGNPGVALPAIEQSFRSAGWMSKGARQRQSGSGQSLVMTSPRVHGGHGTVIVESTAGSTELTISSVSACYEG